MMKILAIYFDSGNGTNVIYDRLIAGIAAKAEAEVDVLCDFVPDKESNIPGLRNRYYRPYSRKMQGWYRRFLRWFGVTPVSDCWSRRVAKIVATDYDIVIAICANSQLTPVVCGKFIAKRLGCKFGIYAVDAIPGPGGWTKRKNEYRGKLRIVARDWSAADYVASSNKHMLEFQLSLFKHKEGMQTNVLYTSSPEVWHTNPISNRTLFLYTGSLYGLRNSDYLFGAFKRILAERPDAELMLVGIKFHSCNATTILTPEECQRVIFAPHTDNLAPLFAEAKVLLDIDADRQKDPFLSSKIATYLRVNRMIVCETGADTPSRELFAGRNTIIQCNHSVESMYEGMKRALEMAESKQDYSERKPLIELFSIDNVSARFWDDLQRLCPTSDK